MEFDLYDRWGHTLTDVGHTLTWHLLGVFVRNLPKESATVRAVMGENHQWDLTNQLLAAIFDKLNTANWQRGSGKEHERPEPLPRPGVEPTGKAIGGEAVSMEVMAERLAKRRHLSVVEDN